MMMGVLLMSLLQFIEDRLDIRINLQKELAASLFKGFVRCLLGLWSPLNLTISGFNVWV